VNQATGMALPRDTTLIDNTVKRLPKLVASRAKANRVAGQPLRIQASSGATQVVTSSSSRCVPGLAVAG
jgi:hypothetical protein